MKDKILISSKPFEQSIKFGNIYYIGNNLSRDPDYICFLDGYIIDCDFDHYLMIDIFKHEGIKGFNKYQGQFNVIIYNIMSNRLYFTNDFFAPLSLYYYNKSGFFVLSNLFWDVVNLVNPGIADLDIDTVSQFAIYGSLLDKNTIIKNLYIMDTASNYEYNFANNSLVCEKYDDYSSFTEDDMSLDEATDKLQQSILSAVNYVKRKHKGQKIGVCVSGGLDSRILPKLFGKYATYFVITGPKKLKKWCKPYNFSYIDQIADAYGIDINKISQTSTPYEKITHRCKEYTAWRRLDREGYFA